MRFVQRTQELHTQIYAQPYVYYNLSKTICKTLFHICHPGKNFIELIYVDL